MSEIINSLNSNIISNPRFINDKKELFSDYVKYLQGDLKEVDRKLTKRLISVSQYFSKSSDPKIRKEGSVLLAILLDIASKQHNELIMIAKNIFLESGDFPNITLLDRKEPDIKMEYGFYTDAKFDFKRELNSVEELSFPLTDYQRILWKNLKSDEDVLTIAPTSAGKTHIILTYLVKNISSSIDSQFAAIVVPTRALISEVSSKVYEIAKSFDTHEDIEICTIPSDDREFSPKTIFIMTQERLYELIQRGDLSFNYLFIDEAHNISDKSRGVLLHLTLEKLLEDSLPQIIVSMPSESYQNAFTSIFSDIEFHKEITQKSPVEKILMSVNLVGKDMEISCKTLGHSISIPKGFTGRHLGDIVLKLGKNQSNIIYRNQTNFCEKMAQYISDRIYDFVVTEELEEASDYIEKFIHEEFSLAKNLRKGVAFHYGPLPSSVRIMIESLAKSGQIKYIACTSTLAEGVNLPAKNLFLNDPFRPIKGKPSERLENVTINNITGRAGRMLEHFSGNIFLIEPEAWKFKDYFEEADNEEQNIPSYYKTLNTELGQVLNALSGMYPHTDSDQYRFYTIANKLIKEFENEELERTLESEELQLSKSERRKLVRTIENAHSSLVVAPFILEANPTVGYIQQNKLFKFLESVDDITDWILPHPKTSEFYEKLLKILSKLNDLGVYINTEGNSIKRICMISDKWASGRSLKEIISEQVSWEKSIGKSGNINSSVRRVIKAINDDVRFRVTNALSCYHLLLTNKMRQKKINKISVKVHTYLEIGACEENMVNLINMGLSRESATEICTLLRGVNIISLHQLVDLISQRPLNRLHPITKKEILSLAN